MNLASMLCRVMTLSAFLPASFLAAAPEGDTAGTLPGSPPIIEFLPMLSYDSDVGMGYGAKAVFRNQFGENESFDVVLFNSSKGERWYRFVFSLPDIELRQGKSYPLAVDFAIDYDKWIRNSFFGIGENSRFGDREYYTKEPLDVSLTLNRGFTPEVVGQAGVRYRAVRNFNFENNSRLAVLPPPMNAGRVSFVSLYATIRYDTRNSFINPSRGVVLQAEAETAPSISFNDISGTRLAGWIQYFVETFIPGTVLATRLGVQGLEGNDLPVQILMSIGGTNTLRGYSSDRYLDRVAAVFNTELRFPILWRFGGIAGLDAGKVSRSLRAMNLHWAANPALGLRLLMETFVVRLDVGFGSETTGFYLNFGQLF